MSNFNIMGSYSGIDMSVIDQMIEAEKAKGVQFTNRKDKIEREQGAWKDVGTRLTSLGQKTDVLSRRGTFESRTVKSSATGNAAVSVTAGNSAPVGDYRVHVKQLATSTRLTGKAIKWDELETPSEDKSGNPIRPMDRKLDLDSNSSLKFKNADGKAFEVKVTKDDSLRKISENINKETKESGIRASIVDNRLILTDTHMGEREITIEANDTAQTLGFELTDYRFTGNAITDLDLDKIARSDLTIIVDGLNVDITNIQGDSLEAIKDSINQQLSDSGIIASISDQNGLVLTDNNSVNRTLTVKDGAAAQALGLVDIKSTILTGGTPTFSDGIGSEGNLTVGDITVDIKLTDTLDDIVNKINLKTEDSGITASIEADNKLVLTADGDQNLEVTDDSTNELANKLGFGDGAVKSNTFAEKLGSTVTLPDKKGQNAKFTIDDLPIERNTNRISDAIEGMAFTLSSVHAEGQSELISVTNNTQKGVDAVKEFVDQYNSVMNFIQTQTDVGTPTEDNNTTGALVGEGSIMRLQSGLRSLLTSRIGGNSDIKAASDLGITTDRYGVASLDEAKLAEVLREDPESVARFFYKPEAADVESTEPAGRSVDSTKGMSELFENLIETYTARSKGIISTKNASYERMVKQINEQIETFNERIDRKRDRYIKQFAALDEAMMRAESQMEYLYSQMNIE